MNLKAVAITVSVLLAALASVMSIVSYGMNHERSGEDTAFAAYIAKKISSEVSVSATCNQSLNSVSVASQQWTIDGATVVASISGGIITGTVTMSGRTFPIDQPLWTSCQDPGETVTASGA